MDRPLAPAAMQPAPADAALNGSVTGCFMVTHDPAADKALSISRQLMRILFPGPPANWPRRCAARRQRRPGSGGYQKESLQAQCHCSLNLKSDMSHFGN